MQNFFFGCCNQRVLGKRLTIDMHKPSSVTDESFRSRQQVIETDTQSNLLDDFVGVFCVDVVFYGKSSIFLKVLWDDLDQVRDFGL